MHYVRISRSISLVRSQEAKVGRAGEEARGGRGKAQGRGERVQVLDHEETVPVGWTKVTGHMVFDVKMDFTQKAGTRAG